jgi:hypothetical protein
VKQQPAERKSSSDVPLRPALSNATPAGGVEKPSTIAAKEPSAAAALAAAFEFPADESGRLLAERLTPPRQVPLAPTPFVQTPRPRPGGMPVPPAVAAPAPLVIGDERRSPQRGQPAVDRPPLAAEADPVRPQRPTWPAAALAYVSSPSADAVPALRYVGLPPSDMVTPRDDPAADSARAALLAGTSIPAPVPPPALRPTIPDPFPHARVVALQSPPAERDPPESSFQRPQPDAARPSVPSPVCPDRRPQHSCGSCASWFSRRTTTNSRNTTNDQRNGYP